MSKIAIVSDKTTLLNTIQAKLVLLRNDDTIIKSDTENFYNGTLQADIVLLHPTDLSEKTLTTIFERKQDDCEIILILETFNPKDLLKAYDNGISDFCTVNITNFELLIKIINAKKTLKKQRQIKRLKNILHTKGALKVNQNIFTNITDIINEHNFEELISSTILAISFNDETLNSTEIENHFQFRDDDIIINHDKLKYIIILYKTPLKNVKTVFEKLKNSFNDKIKGIAFEYNNENANEIKTRIQRLEAEIENTTQDLLIWEFKENEETEEDWLNTELSSETKNYKFFQNIYNKKIETIIEPVFYRIKQKYEHNLKNTKIKYYTDKDCCEFIVVNFEKKNSCKIEFKNSAILDIKLIYNGLDMPENEIHTATFAEFTTRYLTNLLEEFIQKGEI